MSSQRTGGFRGGIQAGSSATTDHSRELDKIVKGSHLAPEVLQEIRNSGLIHVSGIRGDEVLSGLSRGIYNPGVRLPGVFPDGGIYLAGKTPVLFSEAKKQGTSGNAIERVFKNATILARLNPDIVSLYFCSGEGFWDDNSAQRAIQTLAIQDSGEFSGWNSGVGQVQLYRFREEDVYSGEVAKIVVSSTVKAVRSIAEWLI